MKQSVGKTTHKKVANKPSKAVRATHKTKEVNTAVAEVQNPILEKSTPTPPSSSLRRWNVWLSVIFVTQAVAILLFSKPRDVAITTNYVTHDPLAIGHPLVPAFRHLFDVNLAAAVALLLLVAGIAHCVVATTYRSRYENELTRGVNRVRWAEYALSTGVILSLLGLLVGVRDVASLVMIFGVSVAVHSLGLLVGLHGKGQQAEWPFWGAACAAGLLPWIVFGVYIFGTEVYGMTHYPVYVYWIFGSMAVLSFGFVANLYLQHKQRGKWASYIYGEKVYMVVSVIAKTALAWQIFAGILKP